MALDLIPVEFAFGDEFDPGEGAVRDQNDAILCYCSWIAIHVNNMSKREEVLLENPMNFSIARELEVMEEELRQMREGVNGILPMIAEVRDMGGVPVLLPEILEDTMNEILGPVAPTALGAPAPAPGHGVIPGVIPAPVYPALAAPVPAPIGVRAIPVPIVPAD